MLHNSKGKLKKTNQNLLVSDPAVIYVSQIIPKCLLMCATVLVLFFIFIFFKEQSILQGCELCHFPDFLPCHKYFTFFFRNCFTAAVSLQTHDFQPENTALISWILLCFQVENHVSVPQLLCWGLSLLVITLNKFKPCSSDLHCPLASLPPSKSECFIFSTHLHDRIRNNVFIQIKHQL